MTEKMKSLQLLLLASQVAERTVERVIDHTFGLTYPQFRTLQALSAAPESGCLGNIADSIRCTRGNLTGIADRLERDGWIERVRSKEDRRVVNIRLTDAGARVLADVESVVASLNIDVPAPVAQYLEQFIGRMDGISA